MTEEDAVITRLDAIIAILKLANRDAIDAARNEILADDVNRAILSSTSRWVPAGTLQKAVARKTGASTRTARDRLADLLADGLLEKAGGGPTTTYRATGLI
jgi:hypothetical protein